MYEMIEQLMPGSKKIELFARNHNLRPGWFSLGNQLGELYEKWNQTISCNICKKSLKPGIKRFKSTKIPDHDLCEECYLTQKPLQEEKELNEMSEELENTENDFLPKPIDIRKCQEEDLSNKNSPRDNNNSDESDIVSQKLQRLQEDTQLDKLIEQQEQKSKKIIDPNFLEIENKVDEDILHYYHQCDHCKTEPIWGIRFECQEENCYHDYCEACLDKNIVLPPDVRFHDINHKLKVVEVPKYAHGFPVHYKKCNSCHQKPIIGVCFQCKQCSNFNLCQPCFFQKTPTELSKSNRGHKPDHKLESIFETQTDMLKLKFKCNGCQLENLQGDIYQCDNCFGFYFCKKCYLTKRDDFKTMMATSHKNYHQFSKISICNMNSTSA